MKLTEQTTAILKNFSSINNSIKFQAGNEIRSVTQGGEMVAVAKVAEEFPQDFAIYDLSRFIACANLLDQPSLEFHDNFVMMQGENNSIRYGYTDPSLFDGANYQKAYAIDDVFADLEITQLRLQKIRQAASVIGSPNISVIGDGKTISLIAHDLRNKSADRYKVVIKESDAKFSVNYRLEDFKMISDDYDLQISNGIITKFIGNLVTYNIAAEIIIG
jgi:hypothetical protein